MVCKYYVCLCVCISLSVLTDTELRQKTIEGGKKYATETFDPQKLARQLMGVYEKLKN